MYLFVLAINELSLCLQQMLNDNLLPGITLGPNCPPIHSILFDDDLIIYGKVDIIEVQQISTILQNFCSISSQMPNWNKSSILFSKYVDQQTKNHIKNIFLVQYILPNTIHLGHPIIVNHSDRIQAYDFVYQKLITKLTTVKANKLNHAGRMTYIQSVLSFIPIFYMAHVLFTKKQHFKLPPSSKIFGGTVSRKKMPPNLSILGGQTKDSGGLSFKNIENRNKSVLLKIAWNIVSEQDPHLTVVLKSKYFHNTSFWKAPQNVTRYLFWASILKIKNTYMMIFFTKFLKEIQLSRITLGHLSRNISTPTCKTHHQTL
jgi:hypothetical protein